MKRVFARIVRNRKSPVYGKVEMQIREVTPEAQFSTTHLTHHTWCIAPTMVDGVETMCQQPAHSGSHGWLCQYHYLKSNFSEDRNRADTYEKLDADNIKFIVHQDYLNSYHSGVRLGPFKGLYPLNTPDQHDLYELSYDDD